MKNVALVLLLIISIISCNQKTSENKIKTERTPNSFAIVIHGGAGGIKPEYFTEAQQTAYTLKLEEALDAGYAILENGGISIM